MNNTNLTLCLEHIKLYGLEEIVLYSYIKAYNSDTINISVSELKERFTWSKYKQSKLFKSLEAYKLITVYFCEKTNKRHIKVIHNLPTPQSKNLTTPVKKFNHPPVKKFDCINNNEISTKERSKVNTKLGKKHKNGETLQIDKNMVEWKVVNDEELTTSFNNSFSEKKSSNIDNFISMLDTQQNITHSYKEDIETLIDMWNSHNLSVAEKRKSFLYENDIFIILKEFNRRDIEEAFKQVLDSDFLKNSITLGNFLKIRMFKKILRGDFKTNRKKKNKGFDLSEELNNFKG
jgi:DNA-binding MarR family transcriptional regulator